MKYKVGDKVRVKNLEWYNKHKDAAGLVLCGKKFFNPSMRPYLGREIVIAEVSGNSYRALGTHGTQFTDEMLEYVVATKRCIKCGEVKPVSEFYKNASSKDGLYSYCKDCAKSIHKKTSTGSISKEAITTSIPDSKPNLGMFEARELIAELGRRGYRGTIEYTEVHKIDLMSV